MTSTVANGGGSQVGRIVFDGLNLSLKQGTGIATYTRVLTRVAHDIGYDVGILYSTPFTPAADPALREIAFFDEKRVPDQLGKRRTPRRVLNYLVDQIRYHFPVTPLPFTFSGTVVSDHLSDLLPHQDHAFVARNLFKNARDFYGRTKRFVELTLDPAPDIFHCTYPLPFRIPSARNICTIHDLVPLRLPFATMDSKRRTYEMFKKIALEADHIVTVSETSKRDIVELLGVHPDKVTNTYQAVDLPKRYLTRTEDAIANYVEGALGVPLHGYLIFFGSIEPKKNIRRLIEAYLSSGVEIALVLVTSPGWDNEVELALIEQQKTSGRGRTTSGPSIRCLDYVDLSTLVTLLRGARAAIFPSLYEGFGLPVLEAMVVGTPVVTARAGALPEIAGDAALLVDPYDVDDIAHGIKTIVEDADLRRELSKRGLAQAARFSIELYRERVQKLYAELS